MDDGEAALAGETLAIYEREAIRFDAGRSRALFERGWLDRLTRGLPPDAPVLDVGCGAGEPIAGHLIGAGFRLTGVDGARAMLSLARARWPEARFVEADMRTLDLGSRYAAVLAWDSFFHLTADEQRGTLPRLAAHVSPGGRLLLTVGPQESTAIGRVGESAIFHASLALSEYAAILERAGLAIVAFIARDETAGGHTVLLAERAAG